MSKNHWKVRMLHYDRKAYYLYEKSFVKGYKFMKLEYKEVYSVYQIDRKDLVLFLEYLANNKHDLD